MDRPVTKRIVILCAALSLALAFLAAAVDAKDPVCAKCRRPIDSGRWFQIDGLAYHYNHFTCANCNRPIGERKYIEYEGSYFDSTCYVRRFSRKCDVCREPLREWVTIDGKDYHESCYNEHRADRCALCGKPITGTYMYDDYGAKIHAEHLQDARQCNYCSRFISANSNGGERYSDGRVVCGFCLESVVKDKDEADSLMQVVRQTLALEGIVIKQKKLPLELVSQKKMQSLSPGHAADMAGFTKVRQTKSLMGLVKDNDVKIYILDRMPRMNFIATAAHELMHVWLGLNDRFETDEILAEGSCNYAAYLVLSRYPGEADHVIKYMQEDTDPAYGEGYRKVYSYVNAVGKSSWLAHLRTENHPPWTGEMGQTVVDESADDR
ncbi:MAG: protein DA1 [candidate division Zixibacteria bacterium]|nr:protein DA1 [candidate division Zixibacteria bacterium]